jgi:hypothetical protein
MPARIDTTKTLKLDAAYRPLEVIDSLDALIMCIMDKAVAIENYTERILTTHKSFVLPAVIVLRRLVNMKNITLTCTRNNVIWRDKKQCQYCGERFVNTRLTVDHIIPKSRGGEYTWLNLVAACKECNQQKAAQTPEEAGMFPLREPFKPTPTMIKKIRRHQINSIWKEYLWF